MIYKFFFEFFDFVAPDPAKLPLPQCDANTPRKRRVKHPRSRQGLHSFQPKLQ